MEKGKIYYPRITIIGIGGGGGSVVSEICKSIKARRIPHANKIKFVVANVDLQAIKNAPKQATAFSFGKELTHGLGCGMRPEIGERAALEAKPKIERLLKNNDICIFISSLGGGAGSGASPVFAKVARDLGVVSMGIFTKPFSFEGKERAKIAEKSLKTLKPFLNAVSVIPNQRIFKIVDQNTPVNKSLSAMNKILVDILEGLIETLYLPGLINLDFSDLKAMMDTEKSLTYLHSQVFSGKNRAEKALSNVLKNPLINYDIKQADRILFNIIGSKDLKMTEIAGLCDKIISFNSSAKIIFGVGQDNKYKNRLKITLMAVGCEKKKKKKIIKKKVTKKPKPEKKPKKTKKKSNKKEKQKKTVRKNALDLHKEAEQDMQEMLEQESKWDVPTFLRE